MGRFLPRPSIPRILGGAARNVCPRCRKGKIYARLFSMNPLCGSCGYVYERERGYFIGSAVIGYFIGAFSVVPTLAAGLVPLGYPPPWVVAAATLQLVILSPVLVRVSRLLWIHFDYDSDH